MQKIKMCHGRVLLPPRKNDYSGKRAPEKAEVEILLPYKACTGRRVTRIAKLDLSRHTFVSKMS